MHKFNKKVIMVIMDGWGIGEKDKFNAIDNAKTPNYDKMVKMYPNISLESQGMAVGLPDGQFGTSEINHQIIGAGRIILQDLPRINKEIEDGTFFTNESFVKLCEHVVKNKSALHLVGIISDGKIHSSLDHLLALIKLAKQQKVENLYIHAFTDGRDVPPKSTEKYLKIVDTALKGFKKASIATVQGRVWLDRDRDWAKTDKAVNLMIKGAGNKVNSWQNAVDFSYNQNITDEFFNQFVIDEEGIIKNGDSVIFTHYRTDRLHQIVSRVLDSKVKDVKICTFIEVSENFKTEIAFPRQEVNQTLAQTISEAGKKQLHITETEKFTHLTFFMNSGREKEFKGEEWKLLKSNRYVKPYYNFEPSMRAFDITKKVVQSIKSNSNDFIAINYPNCDMVGHTGNYEAAVIATEAVDYSIGKLYEAIENRLDEYALILTADHGNADIMWDYESNQPHTQHTTNPVPFVVVSDINCKLDKRESLEDVAPTIFDLMSIKKPEIMTGSSLIIEK